MITHYWDGERTVWSRKLGRAVFSMGLLLMFVTTALSFVWHLIGIPFAYPLAPTSGLPAQLSGFVPPVGAVLLVIGGLIYGRRVER